MDSEHAIALVDDLPVPKAQQIAHLDDKLIELATGIKADHASATTFSLRSLEHALACGEKLIEAKGLVKHGRWISWVAARCGGMSMRTAQVYMALAHNKASLTNVSTITDAARAIADAAIKEDIEPPIDPAILKAAAKDMRAAKHSSAKGDALAAFTSKLKQLRKQFEGLPPSAQETARAEVATAFVLSIPRALRRPP